GERRFRPESFENGCQRDLPGDGVRQVPPAHRVYLVAREPVRLGGLREHRDLDLEGWRRLAEVMDTREEDEQATGRGVRADGSGESRAHLRGAPLVPQETSHLRRVSEVLA